MTAAITVSHLKKSYGKTVAVADLSFEVDEGSIFGVIGPNGSGKTTAVECIQGLRTPDGGSARVLGLDPRHQRPQMRALVGCQLQESALPERIKVWEALDLFAAISPNAGDWRQIMDDWGLHEKRNSAFAELSGGQRQRLLVALALVNRPRLVFLDEMTTGLDPAARRVAWELIEAIRRQGTTIVLVTHFMDEAERLCDRIVVLERGRIASEGSPGELIERYAGSGRVLFSTDVQDISWLTSTQGVERVDRSGREVAVYGSGPLLAHTAAALVAHGIAPLDLRAERRTLEDAFLRLTDGTDH